MFQSRPRRPAPFNPLPAIIFTALLTALASGGCSPSSQTAQMQATVSPEPRVAAQASRRYDVEDDGMDAQIAPSPSIRMAPDDPSEPFSPNYGPRPAGAPAPGASPATTPPAPAGRPMLPPGLRPTIRSKFASAAGE